MPRPPSTRAVSSSEPRWLLCSLCSARSRHPTSPRLSRRSASPAGCGWAWGVGEAEVAQGPCGVPVAVFGVVPFLTTVLSTMLPMLGLAKHDSMRVVFCCGELGCRAGRAPEGRGLWGSWALQASGGGWGRERMGDFSLCLCPVLWGHSLVALGPTHSRDCILTHYICKDPLSKKGPP